MRRLQEYFMLSDKGFSDLKKGIVACTITNLVNIIPYIFTMLLFAELLKPLLGGSINNTIVWLYFIGSLVGAVAIYFASINDYTNTYVSAYTESENSRIRIVERIRKLPMSVFNSKSLSELTKNLMSDAAVAEHTMSHVVPQLFANCISATLIFVVLMSTNVQLAISIFFTIPLSLGLVYIAKKINDKLGSKFQDRKLEASNQIQEFIDGMKVIKAYNLDGEKTVKLKNALLDFKNISVKYEIATGVVITGAQVILQLGIGVTVLVGVNLISNGSTTFLTLLTFLLMVTRIYGPIITILVLLPELLYHTFALKKTRALMEIEVMEGEKDIEFNNFDIEFKDVTFKYDNKDTLKNINTTIRKGEVTALVGPSGSGKTTMTKLIARFWDVNEGEITIDGNNIKNIDPEYLLKYISFVFQDVILFQDSIYNNILIGNKNATDEQVYAAAKAANCDEFISNLKDGYKTIVGENGATLSGGERQRISIARAILKDSPIILLDEATASIDPGNETMIQGALSKLIKDKTVIVIAHKLKTVIDCDKIIVLEEGKIVEEGQHEELINNDKLYKKLFKIQEQATGWSI